jgi:hypothetical protein
MMKKTVQMKWVIGATAALVLTGGASVARADERIVVTVPFAFIVGDSLLPPGDYVVDGASDDPAIVEIVSVDGRQSVLTMTIPSWSADTPAQPELVFERVGDQRFLAKIVHRSGNDRALLLTPSIEQRELVKIAPHRESEPGSPR